MILYTVQNRNKLSSNPDTGGSLLTLPRILTTSTSDSRLRIHPKESFHLVQCHCVHLPTVSRLLKRKIVRSILDSTVNNINTVMKYIVILILKFCVGFNILYHEIIVNLKNKFMKCKWQEKNLVKNVSKVTIIKTCFTVENTEVLVCYIQNKISGYRSYVSRPFIFHPQLSTESNNVKYWVNLKK